MVLLQCWLVVEGLGILPGVLGGASSQRCATAVVASTPVQIKMNDLGGDLGRTRRGVKQGGRGKRGKERGKPPR